MAFTDDYITARKCPEQASSTPTIKHHRSPWQHLALQLPQTRVAVAQHRRRRVRVHTHDGERRPERLGRGSRARAGEGEAVLGAIGMDDLARDHLETAPLGPVPMAHVAAVNADDNGTACRQQRLAGTRGGVRLHDLCADPQRAVAHRAGVQWPAERQQLGQEGRGFAERHEGGIPGREVGELGSNAVAAEAECGDALRLALTLARADQPAPDLDRHVAEQGAERRPVVALGGEPVPAPFASSRMGTQGRHLRRHDRSLQQLRDPLGLVQMQPELSQADLLITLDAGELGLLDDHASLTLGYQLHPPPQLRHWLTLVP